MASANTLCAEIINVKGTVVTNHEFYNDSDGIKHLRIHVRPNKWHENDCPICHRKCAGDVLSSETRTWRSLDFGEILVELVSQTHMSFIPAFGSIKTTAHLRSDDIIEMRLFFVYVTVPVPDIFAIMTNSMVDHGIDLRAF